MNAVFGLLGHGSVGVALTLLSTFVGERSAYAVYPEIMGCESGCSVVATGWPMTFVSDYLGMSVVNTADIMEVWFAADRLDWLMFLLNAVFWAVFSSVASRCLQRWRTV
jgi:hypothetical protein